MSSELFMGILASSFSIGLGIISWFIKRLIDDMESKIKEAQSKIDLTQEKLDERSREQFIRIQRLVDELQVQMKGVERTLDITNVSVKVVDERVRERISEILKTQSQLTEIIITAQKSFGKVIVKD